MACVGVQLDEVRCVWRLFTVEGVVGGAGLVGASVPG